MNMESRGVQPKIEMTWGIRLIMHLTNKYFMEYLLDTCHQECRSLCITDYSAAEKPNCSLRQEWGHIGGE